MSKAARNASRLANRRKTYALAPGDTEGLVTFMLKRETYPAIATNQFVIDCCERIAIAGVEIVGGGNCADVSAALAMMFVEESVCGDVRIVHGYPVGTGGEVKNHRYFHAWVEGDDMRGQRIALDASNGKHKILPLEAMYDLGCLREEYVHRYSVEQFEVMNMINGHNGPFWGPEGEKVL